MPGDEQAPPQPRHRKRPLQPLRLLIFGVGSFALALGVIFGILWLTSSPRDPDKDYANQLKKAVTELPLDMVHGATIGKDDAPVKLVAFTDFQCPFCLKFAATQEPTLIDEYVKTGNVQIIYKALPVLGSESEASAAAAACAAEQGKFWQYYDHLYLVQAEAGQYAREQRNVGRFSDAKLKEYATAVGLEPSTFEKCMDSGAQTDQVRQDKQSAAGYGITATPAFVINEVSHGSGAPASLDDWRKILDDAAASAK